MMTKPLLVVFACALFITIGCQKAELAEFPSANLTADRAAQTAVAKGTVSTEPWWGFYEITSGEPGDPDGFMLNDPKYIHDGYVSLPNPGISGSYFSRISYYIPEQYKISGDSIVFESSVQNLRSNSLSNYDVILELIGSLHNIQVHFVADSAFVGDTRYSLGTITKNNLPSLVNYFGTFQKVKLATKKGQTAVYVNNKLLYRFNYKADNKIGDIKEIILWGKGVPSFDYVKLTNSITNKKKLTEDFNTDGQSRTIFY